MNDKQPGTSPVLDRILNVCGIAAPTVFIAAVVVAGALHPNYSHMSQPISALAAREAPRRDLMTYAGMIPSGALTMLFSVAVIRRGRGNPGAVWSGALLTMIGAARIAAGLFPCDPGCCGYVSVSAKLHFLCAVTSLSAGSTSPLAMAFGLRSRRPGGLFAVSLAFGLCAFTALGVLNLSRHWTTLTPYVGLIQRVLVGITFTWMILLVVRGSSFAATARSAGRRGSGRRTDRP